jgi:hypothetical protein
MGGHPPHRAVAGTRFGVHRPGLGPGDGQCRYGWWGDRLAILNRCDWHRLVGCRDRLPLHRYPTVAGEVGYGLRMHGYGLRRRLRGRDICGDICGDIRKHRGRRSGGDIRKHRGRRRGSGIRMRCGRRRVSWWRRGGEYPGVHTRQHQDKRGARHQGNHSATQTEHKPSPSLAHGRTSWVNARRPRSVSHRRPNGPTCYDFLRSTASHVALDHPGYRPADRYQIVTVTGRNARDSENASRMLSSGRSASGASLVSPPGPAPINWSSKK